MKRINGVWWVKMYGEWYKIGSHFEALLVKTYELY